ncbi:MAG: hypothetical protein KDA58_01775 [Planctomycetaceae bacterium]|nr:hypothetical protein [Planctomycetaceae bacterium]
MSGMSHNPTAAQAQAPDESTTALIRVAALLVFTILFAGLWSADQPDPELLAQRQQLIPQIGAPLSGPIPAQSLAHLTTESARIETKAVTSPIASSSQDVPSLDVQMTPAKTSTDRTTSIQTEVFAMNQSVTVVRDSLSLSNDELMQHLRQLPLGTPDGDYRIVDPQGGVGWLRIRMHSVLGSAQASINDVLTTEVTGTSLTYLRVQRTAAAGNVSVH